jgi:hypothetical protein
MRRMNISEPFSSVMMSKEVAECGELADTDEPIDSGEYHLQLALRK